MLERKCSSIHGILIALTILPALVNGYNCNLSNGDCSQGGDSNLVGYSLCMVRQWSVSAFIQCASQAGVAKFTATDDDGGTQTISAIDILTYALTAPACSECNLATNLQKAAAQHGSADYETFLCNQYHPINAGLCCLRNCLLVMPVEHSIASLCAGDYQDLMNAPTLPESCGGDPNEKSSDENSAAAASSSDSSSPTEATISTSSDPTQSLLSSTVATTSPIANSATSTTGTSTSPTSQTTPTSETSTSPSSQATPNAGAAFGPSVSYFDRLNRLGLTILPILAVF